MGWDGGYKHICQVIVEAQIEALSRQRLDFRGQRLGIISVIGPDYTSTACSSEPGYTATGSAQILQCIGIHWNTLEYTRVYCVRITASGSPVMPLAACPSWIF